MSEGSGERVAPKHAYDAEVFVDELAAEIRTCFGAQLDGIYLHGSLATGSFQRGSSDIDLLLTVDMPPDPETVAGLRALLLTRSGHPYDIELSLLSHADRFPWRYPPPFTWHFSERWRPALEIEAAGGPAAAMPPRDPDLAAHIAMLRARGRLVWGQPIASRFPEVPRQDFLAAVHTENESACLVALRAAPVDGMLNLARLGLYAREGRFASKLEGALWALACDDAPERALIAGALAAYQAGEEGNWTEGELRHFAYAWAKVLKAWLGAPSVRDDRTV